jgi:hypothetical protein
MPSLVVELAALTNERWDPVGIALIRHPLKEDELVTLLGRGTFDDLKI